MKRTVLAAGILLVILGAGILLIIRLTALKPIIVAVVTRSSSGSVVGSSEVNAAVLFTEETPKSPLTLITLDDQWDQTQTRRLITEAMGHGVRFFVTSHPSKCAVEVKDLFARDSEALMLVTASTTDALTGLDDEILRVVADVAQEQRQIARYVAESTAGTILVVQDTGNRPYTDPAYRVFFEEMTKRGDYTISHREILVADYRPEDLQSFLAAPADLLYILAGSYQPAVGTIAQLFHLIHPGARILLTPWTRSPAILEAAGPAADRIVLPSHYPSRWNSAAISGYVARFRSRFGYEPISMSIGVRQSLELLDAAFRAGMRSPKEVKQYLLDRSPHATSLGPVSFDRYGDATSQFYFIDDLQGEFTE